MFCGCEVVDSITAKPNVLFVPFAQVSLVRFLF
jgi:hypothetical protein